MNVTEKFCLKKFTKVKVSSVSINAESHGGGKVKKIWKHFVDIKATFEGGNDVLKLINPGLYTMLYTDSDGKTGDLADQGSAMTMLRFPHMSAFKYGLDLHAFEGSITAAIDDKYKAVGPVIEFNEARTKEMEIQAKDGGSVILSWSMRFPLSDGAEILDDLAKFLREECYVTYQPTAESSKPDPTIFSKPADDASKVSRVRDELVPDGNGGFKSASEVISENHLAQAAEHLAKPPAKTGLARLDAKAAKTAAKKTAAKKVVLIKKAASKKPAAKKSQAQQVGEKKQDKTVH